jgi:beta-glucanase (GH16 family)
VVATLPAGDWLWPAIWMLPMTDTYGQWPASGEIDIAESRGNNYTYALGGNNIMSSTLHWGPTSTMDAWYRTFAKKIALHTTFAAKPHTFGLEWSEKYIFTYVDERLLEALYVPFSKPLWPQGNFDASTQNGTRVVDPWSQTNGWWTDGLQGKPWVDDSPTAPRDFWNARDDWYPTWKENGQMRVQSIKVWQQGGYQGCTGTKRRR